MLAMRPTATRHRPLFIPGTLTAALAVPLALLPATKPDGCSPAAAAEEPPAQAEWIELFDGHTLNGWHTNPKPIGHGTGGRWAVEDGAITGEQDPPGSGNGGILLTDRKFADFELELEIRPDWGVCSGLFLRANDQGQCFQVMVDYHDAGNVGHIYGEGTGGFSNRPFDIFGKYDDNKRLVGLAARGNDAQLPEAYSIAPEDWLAAWKLDDWNTLRVRCVGQPPHITTWINGAMVTQFDGAAWKGANYDAMKVAEQLGRAGSIAVQVHGGGDLTGQFVRYRNIRVKQIARP